jgi:hypothetical protein
MGFFKDRKSDHADAKTLKAAGLGAVTDMKAMAAQMQEQFAGAIQSAQTMDAGAQIAIAQRHNHLMANGVEGTATINSARDLGASAIPNCSSIEFALTLTDGPGAPRNITVRQDVGGTVASYAAGQQVTLKVDPNNPDDAMLDAQAAVPGGSDARMMKLERLAAMHEAGAFSDEEFATKKAAVLAEE